MFARASTRSAISWSGSSSLFGSTSARATCTPPFTDSPIGRNGRGSPISRSIGSPVPNGDGSAGTGTLLTCIALVVVPLGLGALLGIVVRRLRGRRLEGALTALACVALPAAAVFAAGVRYPIVGPWDSAVEAALFGIGVVCGGH